MKESIRRAAGVLLVLAIATPGLAQQPDPDTVVLKVNEEPVFFWELAIVIPQVQMEMLGQGAQPEREAVVNASMKRVVDLHLLAAEARRQGLQPVESRVDAAMAQLVQQAGGRDNFEQSLRRFGVSYDQLKSNAAEADLVQVYIDEKIDPQVAVTAEDVEQFYNQNPEMFERPDMVRARHILIRISQGADQAEKDAARARATGARQRVMSGEDFAKVASEVSEGREAADGGDLGFFARDQMVPVVADAAFALEIGEVSAVLESQFGFHFVKVEEKQAASKMTFEAAKAPLEEMLREQKAGERVAEVLADLVERATILNVPPPASLESGTGGG
jgi:peptidyl-prolyl cis-trans isomerase C